MQQSIGGEGCTKLGRDVQIVQTEMYAITSRIEEDCATYLVQLSILIMTESAFRSVAADSSQIIFAEKVMCSRWRHPQSK